MVGIDSEAGPTEIGILADDSAEPGATSRLISSPRPSTTSSASCLLVTDSAELLDAVDAELEYQVPATRHVERVRAALAGQSAYVLVDDIEAGLQVVDAWAAEHLEVVTRDARKVADARAQRRRDLRRTWSPVSLGDYLAGSNHVLPTGGTARFTGGLSVQAFQRMIHVIDYDREALRRGRAAHRRARRRRGSGCARRRGPRQRAAGRLAMSDLDSVPLRDDLRGEAPTAHHKSTSRCG